MKTTTERFHEMLAERGYQADAAQLAALDRLQRLSDELAAFARRRRQPLRRWIVPPSSPRGVWLYGGVGRGKSFLMDCFHETVPIRRKARLHFHEFMRGVHRETARTAQRRGSARRRSRHGSRGATG